MKNKDLFTLKKAIAEVKDKGTNVFKLPLILNEMKIDEHIKALEELRKPSESYNKFIEERKSILAEHAEIDEQGQIMLYSQANGQGERRYDYGIPNIVKETAIFEEKATALEDKYRTTLKAEKAKHEDFIKTLEEDCDIELKSIDFEDVPEIPYDYLKLFFETGMMKE